VRSKNFSEIKGFEIPLASLRSKPHLLYRFLKTFCGLLKEGEYYVTTME
jgi:hypothetical protein